MRFIDQVRVIVRAGRGGDGAVAWRKEKYVPKGGPAGGDGGRGGDVILEADPHLSTLLELHFRRAVKAEHGQPGGTRDRNGRGGKDLIVKVPVGTMVYIEGAVDDDKAESAVVDEGGMETVYVVEDAGALARLEQARAEQGETTPLEEDVDEQEQAPGESAETGESADAVESTDAGERTDAAESTDAEAPTESAEAEEPEVIAEAVDGEGEAPANDVSDSDEPLDDESLMPTVEEIEAAEQSIGELIGDLTDAHQRLVIAKGGQGGRGNIHFRSATNRAPDRAEPGTPGEAWYLRLELKLLADVGIVGYPNVGKSTLIRKISRARPKVGAYPFTTLTPNLGVVPLSGNRSMVVADVPGLIEGASDGKGLGHQFLRHLERTRVLLHVLAPDYTPGRDPLTDLETLERELERYGSQFDGRPRVVALNKLDLLRDEEGRALVARIRATLRERNIPLFTISAQTGAGIPKLLEAIWRRVQMQQS